MPWLDFGITSLLFIFVVICLFLCLLILMQRTKNDGIGSAIASGVTQKYIGVQTSNVLVKGTVWLTVAFFLTSLLLDHLYTIRANAVMTQKVSLLNQLTQPVTTPVPIASTIPGVPTPKGPASPNPAVPPVPVPMPVPAVKPSASSASGPGTSIESTKPSPAANPASAPGKPGK